MTDYDRRLDDIEKRLARLERAAEKPTVDVAGNAIYKMTIAKLARQDSQYCECGRDVCRAPDCPSHKLDPLGR